MQIKLKEMQKATKVKLLLPIITLIGVFLYSCEGSNGIFGHSKTKQEAKTHGSSVVEYVAQRSTFSLLDGTTLQIDTAWTEVSFTFKGDERIFDSSNGYHFSIPFKKSSKTFHFNFSLLDKSNQAFTNGISDSLVQLCPRRLLNTMQVVLQQTNPEKGVTWENPVNTDTLIFSRLDTQ